MQGKVAYIRLKVVRSFPGPYASRSYVHQAALGMHGKVVYIRPKVIGPFPRPGTSGSYVHRAALLISI
jgi:hypothetical protein